MKKMLWIGLFAGVFVVGCMSAVNPDTGEVVYGLQPGVDSAVMATGAALEEVGPTVAETAAIFNPVAGTIGGLIVGALLAIFQSYKKWRQPLMSLTTKYDKVIIGAKAAADVIETVVKPQLELWKQARGIMKSAEYGGAINPDKIDVT